MNDLSVQNYDPAPAEKLYHYCPSKSFWAILESRTLWLSSIHSLNDSAEWHWGRQLVTKALAENTIEFRADFRFAVHAMLAETEKHLLPLMFSLSQKGDLLSQWRAYATDGEGFAISFDATQLCTALPVNMKKVLYNSDEQEALVRNSLQIFASWWRIGNSASTRAVLDVLPEFVMDLLSLKHHSFFEEQEVRMVHLLVRRGDGFIDPGGHTSVLLSLPGVQVNQKTAFGRFAPYIAIPIDAPALLAGVILGPKNKSPTGEIEEKLGALGFAGLPVSRSASTYR